MSPSKNTVDFQGRVSVLSHGLLVAVCSSGFIAFKMHFKFVEVTSVNIVTKKY